MKFQVNPKERFYFYKMCIISLFMFACYGYVFYNALQNHNSSLATTLIIYPLMFFTFYSIISLFLSGFLKGNAIKVGERQFPEAFTLLKQHAKTLELNTIPDMYVLQGGGMLNAFAVRFGRRNCIVLYADVLELAYKQGIEAVSFIIGHELGHIKRGHVSFMRKVLTWPARLIPFLGNAYSRACEYTCDSIGYSLCPTGAMKGLLVLAAGKRLYQQVNVNELLVHTKDAAGFDFWLVQLFSTHPALIKRVAAIDKLCKDDMTQVDHFVSPKINTVPRADSQQKSPYEPQV